MMNSSNLPSKAAMKIHSAKETPILSTIIVGKTPIKRLSITAALQIIIFLDVVLRISIVQKVLAVK